jgi:hypothetical protein
MITAVPGLRNDSTTPDGARDHIKLGADQTIAGLDFGLVRGHHGHRGEHGELEGHDD